MSRLLHFLLLLTWSAAAFAQGSWTVKGQIEDSKGELLPGATVLLKGTTKGTVADANGKFALEVPEQGTLVCSYIGYKNTEIALNKQTFLKVVLQEGAMVVDEVVVIGYGSAKSKDLTSPITTVKSEDISSMAVTSPMAALQGKVSGVNIVNTGTPGGAPSVVIRGIGTMSGASPLYVVDGMFFNDIAFLNPNDVESLSVMKDASAAAIYGVRAANGVVIVTTKSGKKGSKFNVTYDGYYGVQKVQQRLDMATAAQYANVLRQSGDAKMYTYVTRAIAMYGGADGMPAVSTDWYKELMRSSAAIQNHSINMTGGTDNAGYAFGFNAFNQDGLMDTDGNYTRYNIRTKADVEMSKYMKVGASMTLSTVTSRGDDHSAWFHAYKTTPLMPVYDYALSNTLAFPVKYANPHGFSNNEGLGYDTYYTNPLAVANYRNQLTKSVRVLPNLYLEARPLANNSLVLRSSYSMDYAFHDNRTFIPEYTVGKLIQQRTSLNKGSDKNFNYVWDNTATYNTGFGGHDLEAMIGFSVREENFRSLWGSVLGVPDGNEEYWYLNNGDASTRRSGDGGTTDRGVSTFGRVSYNYKGRYLLSATMRADGSSKYQDKWGYFPSVGLGWVVSEEAFLKSFETLSFLKLRGSWGLLGSDRGRANDGFSRVNMGGYGESGIFGNNGMLFPGMVNDSKFSYLAWEMVAETNVGIDAAFSNNRLTVEADYFIRDTRDMVINTTLPNGNGFLLQNAGEVRNSGLELTLGWNDKVGDFTYSVGGNFSTLKNEVRSLNGQPYLLSGEAEWRQISMEGSPLYAFYGWKTDGVYQSQAEIDADPIAVANGVKPGYFRYVDQNGDGKINDKDRTILGDFHPDFMYGFYVNAGYKGLSLGMTFQGVQGVDIFNRRRADIAKYPSNNMDADLATNLWTPENPTNSYPSAEGLFKPWNTGRFNDFFIEDGSYFRIQNIRIAYDLPKQWLSNVRIKGAQIYLNADRPFTYFKNNGFTPEVSGGVDREVYPISAVYMLGAKLSF